METGGSQSSSTSDTRASSLQEHFYPRLLLLLWRPAGVHLGSDPSHYHATALVGYFHGSTLALTPQGPTAGISLALGWKADQWSIGHTNEGFTGTYLYTPKKPSGQLPGHHARRPPLSRSTTHHGGLYCAPVTPTSIPWSTWSPPAAPLSVPLQGHRPSQAGWAQSA